MIPEVLVAVKISAVPIRQDRYTSRTMYFVDRVFRRDRGMKAYSNDSSWPTMHEALARKAEIVVAEMAQKGAGR